MPMQKPLSAVLGKMVDWDVLAARDILKAINSEHLPLVVDLGDENILPSVAGV